MDVASLKAPLPGSTVVDELEELLAAEHAGNVAKSALQRTDALERGVRVEGDAVKDARATHGGKRIDSFLEVLRSRGIEATKLPADEVHQQIMAMAAAGYSDAAQNDFVDFLKRKLALAESGVVPPEDAVELATVLGKLRPALPRRSKGLRTLAAFFRRAGFKLRWCDEAPDPSLSYELDKAAFRATLRDVRDAPLGKREVRALLAHLGHVAMPEDLAWARHQVLARVNAGSIEFADRRCREAFVSFFHERDLDTPHRNELFLAARQIRKTLESGKPIDTDVVCERYLEQARALDGNSDDLYFAQRTLRREMSKAAAGSEPEAGGVAQAIVAKTDRFFEECLAGKLDRYSERHRIRGMVEAGAISEHASWMMLAAVSVSETQQHYDLALEAIEFQIRQAISQAMFETFQEISENLRRAGSSDILDSNGNVIKTALEIHLERVERELKVERAVFESRESSRASERASLGAAKATVLSALSGTNDPEFASELRGRHAALDSAAESVDAQPAVS